MKKKNKIISGIIFIIIFAIVSYLFFRPKVIVVETAMAHRGTFIDHIIVDGFFRAKKRYTVTAFAEGDIKRVDFKVGDTLHKNQVITELFWDIKYIPVKAPIAGVITEVYRESAGPIHRGEAIIEIVDPSELELVAELLTTDAAKVKVENLAFSSGWGGDAKIQARVSRISKAGFTKVSALGVEEEKTEVIMEPLNLLPKIKSKLGHKFHTEILIELATVFDALKIPTGALLRIGNDWAIYQVIDGKATLKKINISFRGNNETIVTKGLKEGDIVINYPGDLIKDGTVVSRKE